MDTLADLLSRENVQVHEVSTDLAIQALDLCRPSGRVKFADALLWATARAAGASTVWTFDRDFPVAGTTAAEP